MHMALLPLPGVAARGETSRMTTDALARRLAGTVREMNDAVRLMTEIRLARSLGFDDEVPRDLRRVPAPHVSDISTRAHGRSPPVALDRVAEPIAVVDGSGRGA